MFRAPASHKKTLTQHRVAIKYKLDLYPHHRRNNKKLNEQIIGGIRATRTGRPADIWSAIKAGHESLTGLNAK